MRRWQFISNSLTIGNKLGMVLGVSRASRVTIGEIEWDWKCFAIISVWTNIAFSNKCFWHNIIRCYWEKWRCKWTIIVPNIMQIFWNIVCGRLTYYQYIITKYKSGSNIIVKIAISKFYNLVFHKALHWIHDYKYVQISTESLWI